MKAVTKLLLLGALVLVGCAGHADTVLVVVVDSNMTRPELVSFDITALRDGTSSPFFTRSYALGAVSLPAALAVVPRDAHDMRTVTVTVTGHLSGGHSIVQIARVTIEPERYSELDMYLARECATASCSTAETCGSMGECLPISRGQLPEYVADAGRGDAGHDGAPSDGHTADVVVVDGGDTIDPPDAVDATDATDANVVDVTTDVTDASDTVDATDAVDAPPPPALHATQIAIHVHHACAVMADRTVRCWGDNTYGQLGDGTFTSHPMPTVVTGLSNVVEVAVGTQHTCARRFDGTVYCWGAAAQLGDGSAAPRPSPGPVPTVAGWDGLATHITSSMFHTCAVAMNHIVWCWGRNDVGECGDGSMNDAAMPVNVSGYTSGVVASAGSSHTAAIDTAGSLSCWGADASGQCGDGMMVPYHLTEGPTHNITTATQISAGDSFSCARLMDGEANCWGLGTSGQLGNGSSSTQTLPVAVTGLTSVVAVEAGVGFACAVSTDGSLLCWGSDAHGELADCATTNRSTPVVVSGLPSVQAVATGDSHACALATDGRIFCWGSNTHGELGDGTTADRCTPTLVTGS